METTAAVISLAALAHESRLAVYRLLVEAGPDGRPAGEIAAALDIPPSSLSFHLKELARAGLVSSEHRGRFVVYAADFSAMDALIGYLTKNCCAGASC